MRIPLTGRQRLVYDFIRAFIDTNHVAPTFEEMSKHFGRTLGTLHEQVEVLERKGWIRRDGDAKSQRNISIVSDVAAEVADDLDREARSLDDYANEVSGDTTVAVLRGTAERLRARSRTLRQ